MAKKSEPKPRNFADVDGVNVSRVTYEISQDSDSCQDEDLGQTIKVSTDDAGGGSYVVISTDRWAIDADCIDNFAAMLKRVVAIPEV